MNNGSGVEGIGCGLIERNYSGIYLKIPKNPRKSQAEIRI
jgi:hypothetical protein